MTARWLPPDDAAQAPYWRDQRGFRVCRNLIGQYFVMRPNGRVVLTTGKACKAKTWKTPDEAMRAVDEMDT